MTTERYEEFASYIHKCMDDDVWRKEILSGNGGSEDFAEQVLYFFQSPLLSMYHFAQEYNNLHFLCQWVETAFLRRNRMKQAEELAEQTGSLGEAFYQCSFSEENGKKKLDNLMFAAAPKERLQDYARELAQLSQEKIAAKEKEVLILDLLFLLTAGAEEKVTLRFALEGMEKEEFEYIWWYYFLLWYLSRPEYVPDFTDGEERELVEKTLDLLYGKADCLSPDLEFVIPFFQKLCGALNQLDDHAAGNLACRMSKFMLGLSARLTQCGTADGNLLDIPARGKVSDAYLEVLTVLLERTHGLLLQLANAHAAGNMANADFCLGHSVLKLEEMLRTYLKHHRKAGAAVRPVVKRCSNGIKRKDVQNLYFEGLRQRPLYWMKKKLLTGSYMNEEDLCSVFFMAEQLEQETGKQEILNQFWDSVIEWMPQNGFSTGSHYQMVFCAAYRHISDITMRTELLQIINDSTRGFGRIWTYPILQAVQGKLMPDEACNYDESSLWKYHNAMLEFLVHSLEQVRGLNTESAVRLLLDVFVDVCRCGGDMDDYADEDLWGTLQAELERYCSDSSDLSLEDGYDAFWAQAYAAVEFNDPNHLLRYAAGMME